jgi:contractile injection system tube protein
MEQLTHATIVARYEGTGGGRLEMFDVQFNPTELTFDKSVQLAEISIPGLDSPLLQFVRGQNERLSIELFFDTTEDGTGPGATSVTTQTDRFYSLVKIDPDTHAPPICELYWNSNFPGADLLSPSASQARHCFTFIVESVRQKFTFFSPDGTPLRATLTLSLREYKTLDEQLSQLNLSSPDRTHAYVTAQGDTLAKIAGQFYRKPGAWRAVADENDIEDPRRLAPARILTIPPIA